MKLKPFEKSGLYRAILVVGNPKEFRYLIESKTGKKISRQRLHMWKRYGGIPKNFVQPIHEITHISLADLLEPFEPVVPADETEDEAVEQ